MSKVRAFITFASPKDNPDPWDGLLVTEQRGQVESVVMVCENVQLAKIQPDGKLFIFDGAGLKESGDMAALGRAFYRAMTGKEPPT